MSKLNTNEVTTRFIYGSNRMNDIAGYDNTESYSDDRNFDDNGFCRGNCLHCESQCPYKEY
jgi:hypothetical protein